MSSNTISDKIVKCHHNDVGYCKNGNLCKKHHSEIVCEKRLCQTYNCENRHPRQCKFYAERGYCKFGTYCKYRHQNNLHASKNSNLESLENKIMMLEENNKSMENRISEQHNKLENILSFEIKINTLKIEIKKLEESISNLCKSINETELKIELLNKPKVIEVTEYPSLVEGKEGEDVQDDDSLVDKNVETKLNDNIHPCDNCKNWFNIHKTINDYMCDQCLTSLAKKGNIELPDKFQCNLCKSNFKTRNEFVYHTDCKFEYENMEFICVDCGTCWKNNQHLKNHQEESHVEYECDYCGITEEGEKNIDLHLRKVHEVHYQ